MGVGVRLRLDTVTTKMAFKVGECRQRRGALGRGVMQKLEPDPSWDPHPDSQWAPEGAAGGSP